MHEKASLRRDSMGSGCYERRVARDASIRSELPINTHRLTAGYRPQCCWFVLFESARKVILIC